VPRTVGVIRPSGVSAGAICERGIWIPEPALCRTLGSDPVPVLERVFGGSLLPREAARRGHALV
jgi:hypothetical protein